MASELTDSGLRRFEEDITRCPEATVLRLALDESTKSSTLAALTAHLDGCPACCHRLEQLATSRAASQIAAEGEQLAVLPPQERLLPDVSALAGPIRNTVAADGDTPRIGDTAIPAAAALDFLESPTQPGVLGLLHGYHIKEILGQGGMGIVLRALDPALGREVAIKVLLPELATSRTACERFVREARAAAANNHKNIVTVHAVNDQSDPPYFVMQLIEGESLAERLARCGTLPADEIVDIGLQVAAALVAAHEKEMVHRDIKPANILLSEAGTVHLSDFGLVKVIDDVDITRSGVIAGTPEFMSPEQAEDRPVDGRSDLFGLGAVMYVALVGQSPFRASTAPATLRRICEYDPPRLRRVSRSVPGWLSDTIHCLLEKNPDNRVESAEALIRALSSKKAPRNARSIRRNFRRTGIFVAASVLLLWFGVNYAAVFRRAVQEMAATTAPVAGTGFVNHRTGQTFQSLNRATLAAENKDTIDVWIDGEIRIEPVLIYGKELTIRAAPNCQPILLANADSFRVPAVSSDSNLILNQLHFRWDADADEKYPTVRTTVRIDGASLQAKDCRFTCENTRRVAIRVENGSLDLDGCDLTTTDTACISWVPGVTSTARLMNCDLDAPIGLYTTDKYDSRISLMNNRWRGATAILVRASVEPDHRLTIVAQKNVFASHALLAFLIRDPADRNEKLVLDESYLRSVVLWKETDNEYSPVNVFAGRVFEVPPLSINAFGPNSSQQWRAVWR